MHDSWTDHNPIQSRLAAGDSRWLIRAAHTCIQHLPQTHINGLAWLAARNRRSYPADVSHIEWNAEIE